MKKITTYTLASTLLFSSMSSCGTMDSRSYLGTMAGAEIGGTIGEAIGWMATSRHDGPGKAMLGSIVGTIVGAAVGNSLSSKSEREAETSAYIGKKMRKADTSESSYDDLSTNYSACPLVISNLTYQDEDGDGRISKYETINVIYEVTNTSDHIVAATLSIDDAENAKTMVFSPSTDLMIDSHQTIRYKAKAFCNGRPKNDRVNIHVFATSIADGVTSSFVGISYNK